MTAFCSVILLLLIAVNLWNYFSVTSQLDRMLIGLPDVNMAENGGMPPKDDGQNPAADGPFSPEVQYGMRFFTVRVYTSGETELIDTEHIASVSESAAASYAKEALSSGKSRGYFSGYRYVVKKNGFFPEVCFLNCERELRTMRTLFFITVVAALASNAVVLLLVVVFSKKAIAPYAKNLETQKQFITNAGHELKTPIASISACADVLCMEEENEWVKNIQTQTKRLSQLVSDLVTLCRLDEENPFPEKTEFSLSEAVWEIAEPFETLACAKGKALTLDIADDVSVTGDKNTMQQMISVLLENAVKYSSEGADIELKLYKNGRKIIISVYNDCDIPEGTEVDRLFERFYRPDSSRSKLLGGTGLGLAVAKAAAVANGGDIRAEKIKSGIIFKALF